MDNGQWTGLPIINEGFVSIVHDFIHKQFALLMIQTYLSVALAQEN